MRDDALMERDDGDRAVVQDADVELAFQEARAVRKLAQIAGMGAWKKFT
jgi:hypothetical protein